MAIFNSYVKLPEGRWFTYWWFSIAAVDSPIGTSALGNAGNIWEPGKKMATITRCKLHGSHMNSEKNPLVGHFLTSNHSFIRLVYGKIYRKPLYLMVKTMVSCRISFKPIQWFIIFNFIIIIQSMRWPMTSQSVSPFSRMISVGLNSVDSADPGLGLDGALITSTSSTLWTS